MARLNLLCEDCGNEIHVNLEAYTELDVTVKVTPCQCSQDKLDTCRGMIEEIETELKESVADVSKYQGIIHQLKYRLNQIENISKEG